MKQPTPTTLAVALTVFSLTLASACGSPSAAGNDGSGARTGTTTEVAAALDGDVQRVTVKVGNSVQFAPARVTVETGKPVELILENGGAIPHDFTLTDGVTAPVKIEAQGGQTARGTFTVIRPGTYTFVCSVPGHAQAGMRGTVTAQ